MLLDKCVTLLSILYLVKLAFQNDEVNSVKYIPTWDSLDSRPLPSWYDDAKIGMFGQHFYFYFK